MDIQERINQLRIKKGWSLSHLADQIGLSKNSVYGWFGEKHFLPSTDSILAICEVMNITMTEFFSEIEKEHLSTSEILLLTYFKAVPLENREQVVQIVKSFGKN